MRTTVKKAYGTGELRAGWSSWSNEEKSVKWAYRDRRGRVSIKSPEIPIDVLVEMLLFAYETDLLDGEQLQRIHNNVN